MAFLKITWDSDGSTDIFPLSEKTEQILNRSIDEFLDHLYPKFGNFDNHSTWSVTNEAIVRKHKRKV